MISLFGKSTNKLFLICPNDYLEHKISKEFGGRHYFLTALGAIFSIEDEAYAGRLCSVIKSGNIKEIVVINDYKSDFFKSVIAVRGEYFTKAEKVLGSLLEENWSSISQEKGLARKARLLATLNLERQLQQLKDAPYLGERIANNELKLRGMIYERGVSKFEEVVLIPAEVSR